MVLTSGTRLGSYEIVAPLGAGGMGEVYRARDSTLSREVAIKVLPQGFAGDPERLARFEREARALASLNHPNIAAIYSFERRDGVPLLVLEYVPGETLRCPVAISDAVAICRQICEALEAAHRQGIVHRDLKPSNIKVTPEGKVKILDFGLAKALSGTSPATGAPTLTIDGTATGVILGTAAYMSPEQARGRPVDHRTDIWAFGCVLYELLVGRSPFHGETLNDTLLAILTSEPDWQALPRATPENVRRLLRRCLQKEPERRLHDIADARLELDEPGENRPVEQQKSTGRIRRLAPWLLAAVMAGIAVAVSVSRIRERPADEPTVTLSLLPPEKWTFGSISVSPDGRMLAFTAINAQSQAQLWVRPLHSSEPLPLAGTEGARQPFWSPNSRSLAFFADGKLKKIDVGGGPPQVLCEAPAPAGGAWNSDGVIIFAPGLSSPLYRVMATGGTPEVLTSLDSSRHEEGHGSPRFLPGGKRFLYSSRAWAPGQPTRTVYAGLLDDKTSKLLVSAASGADFINWQGGYLLFVREKLLLAQPFDAERLEIRGDTTVVGKVGQNFPDSGAGGLFSTSDNGVLAYRSGDTGLTQPMWFDRTGQRLGTVDQPGFHYNVFLSPDEKRVSTERSDASENWDVWIADVLRGTSSRLTVDPAPDGIPIWSPDGNRIVFFSNRTGIAQMYETKSSGVGTEERLLRRSDIAQVPSDWSRDGRFLIYIEEHPVTGRNIWLRALDGKREDMALARTRFNENHARLSPDGRWIAYESDESGRYEVYVQFVDAPQSETSSASSRKWQVSTHGGVEPRWRRDGRELYYLTRDGKLMATDVRTEAAMFEAKVPKALFEVHAIGYNRYDVTADGRRFLINVPVETGTSQPVMVVLNWTSALKN